MTATVRTAAALSKACLVSATLLAALAASPVQAAVAQQPSNANGSTMVASYSFPGDGGADIAGSQHQPVSRSAEVAGRAGAGLRLTTDPSLLFVAVLGALCLSLSWRRPASRHAEKLRERLGNGEAVSSAGAQG